MHQARAHGGGRLRHRGGAAGGHRTVVLAVGGVNHGRGPEMLKSAADRGGVANVEADPGRLGWSRVRPEMGGGERAPGRLAKQLVAEISRAPGDE